MLVLELDGKRIIRMTAEGIAYIDEDTFEQFIYFSECYENEVNRRLSAAYWEKVKELNNLDDSYWDDHVERVRRSKEIAARSFHESYIEFYTQPRIRFMFESKDEWWKLRKHIDASGWRTFDLR
jgi:hypothetical protein